MSTVQNLIRSVQNPKGVAGILLVSSFLIPFLALVILITSGAFSTFSAVLQGSLVEMAPYADTFRLLNTLWTAGWIVQLLGFGLLTRLLLQAGDESLAIPAFFALLVAVILGVLHGSFHASVENWAALEAARTGIVPDGYEPLEILISRSFRVAYVTHLLSTIGFGWSILRTRLLSSWAGRITAGWGILWLGGILVGAGLPGILFITPALIGAALFIKSSEKSV